MFKISSANIRRKCFPAKFQHKKFYFQSYFMRFAPQGKPHAHCGACTGKGRGQRCGWHAIQQSHPLRVGCNDYGCFALPRHINSPCSGYKTKAKQPVKSLHRLLHSGDYAIGMKFLRGVIVFIHKAFMMLCVYCCAAVCGVSESVSSPPPPKAWKRLTVPCSSARRLDVCVSCAERSDWRAVSTSR